MQMNNKLKSNKKSKPKTSKKLAKTKFKNDFSDQKSVVDIFTFNILHKKRSYRKIEFYSFPSSSVSLRNSTFVFT